jgi:hypothetical protein
MFFTFYFVFLIMFTELGPRIMLYTVIVA